MTARPHAHGNRHPARRPRRLPRRLIGLILTLLVAGGMVLGDRFGLFGRAPQPDDVTYHDRSFRVTKVVDGDTLDIDHPDARAGRQTTRIRLWGVDTPETVKPGRPVEHFGPEASAFTKRLCRGKTVRIALDRDRKSRDKYGRLLAYVYLPDGRMLNRVLVEEGYAYADPRFRHRYAAQFQQLQKDARKNRRGLWAGVRPEDLPYYYRDKLSPPKD